MSKITLSRYSTLLLHYGLFAIICHSVAIFLYSTTLPIISSLTFSHIVFPMIEHSIVSFIAILIGAVGIEYTEKIHRQ